MLYHELDKLLKAGLGGIPAQTGFGLGGVAQEVYDIGRSVKVFADANDCVSDFQLTAYG